MFRSLSERTDELPPVSQSELPPAQRLYMAAVLLHELSLQMDD